MMSGRIAVVIVILTVNNVQMINTSDKDASKSKANKNDENASKNVNDVWDNWLPFKEKKGSVGVDTKTYYKRQVNWFRLREERDADDYYDKGGESDSEDYYERKEWSDVFRQAHPHAKPPAIKVDHPDLVDIDGVHVKPHHGHHQHHKNPSSQKVESTKSAEKTKESQKDLQSKENKKDKVKKKASSKTKREGYSQERASAIDVFKLF
ncbi:hypothetical protein O0L34_g18816 [Tuta absoluta]|nr:hypothetical protein O0L34_g18816 [Tuta absoluta]